MQLNSKLPDVGTTIFTVMSQLAMRHEAINLGQGFPDFDGPPALIEGLYRHTAAGRNQYAPMTGIAPLREAIAAQNAALYGASVDADHEVTVVSGATEALYAAIAATVRPGDEVLILDPAYDSYAPAVRLQGGVPTHLRLTQPDFSLPWDALADALKRGPRMLIVNNPNNPAGSVLTEQDLAQLANLLEGTPTLLLSDEVYEHLIYDGREHQSVLRHPALRERAFKISSFGKSYHLTGWKIGYCIAPAALTAEFRKVHQYLTFATMTPAQHALADFMRAEPEFHLGLRAFYQAKRDLFLSLIAPLPLTVRPAAGAYFQLVDYSATSELDDLAYARWMTEQLKVVPIPLSSFYAQPPAQRLIRFCFAKRDETLRGAAQRLAVLADQSKRPAA